jgi:hypothetical protein
LKGGELQAVGRAMAPSFGNGATLGSDTAVGAAAGSGAAGASLVLVRPQRAGNGTTVGAVVVGSTGGGG